MGKKVLSGSMSRRDVFKLGSLAAVGVAGASMLGGCAPSAPASSAPASGTGEAAAGENASGLPSFLVKPAEITDFAETKDYDVVVVGAGAAGLAAAIKAAEEGAKVAVVQKESVPSSQGFRATGLDLDKNAIQRIENGSRFVTDVELAQIAQLLQVSMEELTEGQSS